MKHYSIAIDGPAGAGKSTLSKALAARLGFLYVDTGAIYRTVSLHVVRGGGDCGDPADVAARLPSLRLSLTHGPDGRQHMLLGEEDVTDAIRDNAVSRYASQVSAHPAVRDFLLEMQRELARQHNVVMDGRDIGTVVLPQADVKIFLTASAQQPPRWSSGPCAGSGSWRNGASRWTLKSSGRRLSSGTMTTATGPPPPCARRRTRWWWTPPSWTWSRAWRPC